jgi:hypothetical protein
MNATAEPDLDNDLIVLSDDDGRLPAESRGPVHHPWSPLAAGLLGPAERGPACVTCSDEGRVGVIVAAPADPYAPALAETDDGDEEVDVTLVAPVAPGDRILIHAGTAIARL